MTAATSNQRAWETMRDAIALRVPARTSVTIGEPRLAVAWDMVAIVPEGGEVDAATLSAPREIHRCTVRMYRNALQQPQDAIEFDLDQFRADIQSDVFGDFTLGGNVAYALPAEFRWVYEYHQMQNTLYRTVSLTVAYRIDDNAAFAP